jgi:tetraacyldisaccharide 4'-kinase
VRAPAFWQDDGIWPRLLAPAAAAYGWIARRRQQAARPWSAPVPVLSIGNLVAGGAGKTPVAISLTQRLAGHDRRPHLLSRGYGGRVRGPVRVDPSRHEAAEVGDEPLLLARAAPTWVARDRAAGARAAIADGATMLLLDDGHQNRALTRDLALLVIDGGQAFGNRRLIPAGPLREDIEEGLARAHGAVLLGDDGTGLGTELAGRLPLLTGRLAPEPSPVAGKAVVAFAGIGRPEKFFATLEDMGCEVLGRHAFADHHPYREHEVLVLLDKATKLDAALVTTAKDRVRLPAHMQDLVEVVEVAVAWDDEAALDALLAGLDGDG